MAKKKTASEILGSENEPGTILFVLFVPSKTKDGKNLPDGEDQEMWADTVGDVLATAFGGATEMPAGKGKWVNDDGDVITEKIILVHSYASEAKATDEANLLEIAKALHRMGKKTVQGEVGLVIDNVFHRIRKFPLAT